MSDKTFRGNASEFFVAGELCLRGYSAVVTLVNTPNVDVLCSNKECTKFAHIQVKTFKPGNATCSVGLKSETTFGPSFFWVLAGIPYPEQDAPFEYYIIPAKVMASNVLAAYQLWLKTLGAKGQSHNPNSVRTVHLPPRKSLSGWDISKYRDKWKLIEQRLS